MLETATQFEWLFFESAFLVSNSLAGNVVLRSGSNVLNALPVADEVELAISSEFVSFIRATLPVGNRKHVIESLPYLVEDSLMTSPEQAHVVIAEMLTAQDAMLATIDRKILARILDYFAETNIIPQRVFPVTLLPPLPGLGWAVVYSANAHDTEFFVRTGHSTGLPLELDDNHSQSRLPAAPPIALQLALSQAKSSNAIANDAPHSLSIYVDNADSGTSVTQWQEELGLPCTANESPWKQAPSPRMNLLQGDFAPPAAGLAWLKQCKPAVVMLALLLMIQLACTSIDWAAKLHQRNALDTEMKTLFLTTFPDTSAVVDAPLQMQRKHAELQHASGNPDASDFLPLLAAVTSQLGQISVENAKGMDYEAGKLSLQLHAGNADTANELAERLTASGLATAIHDIQKSSNGVDFKLTVQPGSEP